MRNRLGLLPSFTLRCGDCKSQILIFAAWDSEKAKKNGIASVPDNGLAKALSCVS